MNSHCRRNAIRAYVSSENNVGVGAMNNTSQGGSTKIEEVVLQTGIDVDHMQKFENLLCILQKSTEI